MTKRNYRYKKIVFIIFLIVFIGTNYARGEDDSTSKEEVSSSKEFTGAYGYKLGDIYNPFNRIYAEPLNKKTIPVDNKTGFRSFPLCIISITPITHRIYNIYTGKILNDEQSCKEELLILKE